MLRKIEIDKKYTSIEDLPTLREAIKEFRGWCTEGDIFNAVSSHCEELGLQQLICISKLEAWSTFGIVTYAVRFWASGYHNGRTVADIFACFKPNLDVSQVSLMDEYTLVTKQS